MIALKFLEYLLLFNLISLTISEIFTDNIDYPANYEELIGKHTIYNIFKNPLSWNEARAFCRNIGSDLSKVPSDSDINTMAEENKDVKKFFEKEYFTSAVRPTSDVLHWTSDCSNVSVTSQTSNPYEYTNSFTSSTCLEFHRTHFHNFANCSSVGNPFLCEKKINTPCTISTVLATEIVILNDMDENICNEACKNDLTCWGTIATQQQCIKVVIPGYGLSSLSFATKRCNTFEAHYNSTSFQLPTELITADLNRSDPPISSCTNKIVSSSMIPTLPTSYSVEPSDVPISTIIVTSTQFTTLYVTSTQQVVVTVSDPFTVTVTASVSPQIDPTCVTSTPAIETTSVTSTSRIDATPVQFTSQIPISGIDQSLVISASATIDAYNLRIINTKDTSSYRRSVTSAKDDRRTSIVIGITGATMVIIPLWVIIIMDIKKVLRHLCDHRTIYTA